VPLVRRAGPAGQPAGAPAAFARRRAGDARGALRPALRGDGRGHVGHPQGRRRLRPPRPRAARRTPRLDAGGRGRNPGRRRGRERGWAAAGIGDRARSRGRSGEHRCGAGPCPNGRGLRRGPRLSHVHVGLDRHTEGRVRRPPGRGAPGQGHGLRSLRPRRDLPPARAHRLRRRDAGDLGAAAQRRAPCRLPAGEAHACLAGRGDPDAGRDHPLADGRALQRRGRREPRGPPPLAPAPRRGGGPQRPARAEGALRAAGRAARQRLRPDRGHHLHLLPPHRGRRWLEHPHRAPHRQHPGLRARRAPGAGPDRCAGGAVPRRRRPGARLPRPAGADRGALRPGPLRGAAGGAPVPHR
jgi:hypothetical protein